MAGPANPCMAPAKREDAEWPVSWARPQGREAARHKRAFDACNDELAMLLDIKPTSQNGLVQKSWKTCLPGTATAGVA